MGSLGPSQFEQVRRFAETLGTDAIVAPDGSVNFEFERIGLFSILASDDGERLVVALSRAPQARSASLETALLREAGLDPADGALLHAALCDDGTPLLALDLPITSLSPSTLDAALARLDRSMSRVATAR